MVIPQRFHIKRFLLEAVQLLSVNLVTRVTNLGDHSYWTTLCRQGVVLWMCEVGNCPG